METESLQTQINQYFVSNHSNTVTCAQARTPYDIARNMNRDHFGNHRR